MGVVAILSCELYGLNIFSFHQSQVALNGMFETVILWESWVKDQLINLSVLMKTTLITIFWPKHSKLSMKSNLLAFSHIWPCHKKGQRQPKVIKWTILVELEYLMLYSMFQDHQSISSREEVFFLIFSMYGHGSHLGHVTQLIYINFHSHSPICYHMDFGSKSPNYFWGKKS